VGNESGVRVAESSTQSVSSLLFKWRDGDEEALRELLPLVYNELRRLAHYYIQKQRPDHTLQSTALVHEAYLRLVKQGTGKFQNTVPQAIAMLVGVNGPVCHTVQDVPIAEA
jgi:hypothetical protein